MYKKAIVITNGCPENRLDCAEIEFLLIQNECEIVTRVQDADAIIISLCGLQNQTEEKSIDLIKHITKKRNLCLCY